MVHKNTSRSKKPIFITLALILLIIGTVAALELTNTTHLFHSEQPAVTASQDTKGETTSDTNTSISSDTSPSSASDTTQPGDNKSETGGGTTQTLLPPSGNFVSAHTVPMDASLASVCNTTPGATCIIYFTSNGTKKSLDRQTTDRGGSTYWNGWSPRSAGLTVGTGQVSATATLNDKTETSTDATNMVVTQ